MKLFNFYVFNRSGDCLYYREWSRPQNTLHDDLDEERKLVFGMLFSLKDLSGKLSPLNAAPGGQPGDAVNCQLQAVKTKAFTMHHYESTTGLMLVLNADPETASQYQRLEYIYKNIWIEYIARNPVYAATRNEQIQSIVFDTKLEEYLFSAAPASMR